MIVIDGYSIDYHPSSNRIEIILPQTMRTFTNTVSTLKKRLVDVKECELSAILIVAKSMIEGERRMKTRYINADDAIYELKRAFPVEDFNKIIRVISRTPTANVVERKRGRWIPCSDKMPMENTEVLVCDKDGFLSIAEYELIDGEKWWRETTEYRHIEGGAIAWMPLPEPYKGEEG